jgi:L-threonylcarbamoyladenylate synthase
MYTISNQMPSTKTAQIGTDLGYAKALLEAGEVIGLPTETVYGLAGNALNQAAVARIFEVKQRPTFNPLIIHIGQQADVAKYVQVVPPKAQQLMDNFWPGPLTLLLPKRPIVPDLVTAGSDLVAIRMPAHPMALALLQSLSFPLAAPSANPFMYVSPTTAQHVAKQLGRSIPYILDGGFCTVGVESTIIGVNAAGEVTLYRHGGIVAEDIIALVGPIVQATKAQERGGKTIAATPGQLMKHYATSKPTVWVSAVPESWWATEDGIASIGFIGLDQDLATTLSKFGASSQEIAKANQVPEKQQFLLSKNANLTEAATRLFDVMRLLDSHPTVRHIVVAHFPSDGLGQAINDRLGRAVFGD